ncbi:MAG: metallo-mystery pair system four-Cys motif protein [Gemmatimonadaceae bacterium]|nr:metallo-mystery pair system four-Cys motif protein [Gemmatimonadaceae bacterium]
MTPASLRVARLRAVRALSLVALVAAPVGAAHAQLSASQPVALRFRATVDNQPFACGQSYSGIGTTKGTISVTDFRFYVHDVRLVDTSGREVAVQLDSDGLWQSNGVALLDFEDGSGPCSNGNAELRDVVVGSAPAGSYTGVRFTVGVPFDLNHRDLTQQPSPLSLSRLFWAWNSGYKFMRIDMKSGPTQSWVLHLGSTECLPTGTPSTIPTKCAWGNRPEIAFASFDLSRDVVNLDLAAMLRTANVSVNQPKTAMGCMSGQADSDCAPVFAALGLPFGTTKGGGQWAFSVARGGGAAGHAPSAAR